MRYWRLLSINLRLGVMGELAYRANFAIQLIESGVQLMIALAGVALVFSHTDTLGGWRRPELMAIVGVYLLMGGIVGVIIQPSMQQLIADVLRGTLDFVLIKPKDAQFLVSIREVHIWKGVDMVLGAGVLGFALMRMRAEVGLWEAAAFAVTLVAGATILYSFLLILTTSAFWFVRVENLLEIFRSTFEAGRWPVGIYPRWLRATLTLLIPIAFAITVPAESVVGRLNAGSLFAQALLASVMAMGSRWFWKRGIRHYTGASA